MSYAFLILVQNPFLHSPICEWNFMKMLAAIIQSRWEMVRMTRNSESPIPWWSGASSLFISLFSGDQFLSQVCFRGEVVGWKPTGKRKRRKLRETQSSRETEMPLATRIVKPCWYMYKDFYITTLFQQLPIENRHTVGYCFSDLGCH